MARVIIHMVGGKPYHVVADGFKTDAIIVDEDIREDLNDSSIVQMEHKTVDMEVNVYRAEDGNPIESFHDEWEYYNEALAAQERMYAMEIVQEYTNAVTAERLRIQKLIQSLMIEQQRRKKEKEEKKKEKGKQLRLFN